MDIIDMPEEERELIPVEYASELPDNPTPTEPTGFEPLDKKISQERSWRRQKLDFLKNIATLFDWLPVDFYFAKGSRIEQTCILATVLNDYERVESDDDARLFCDNYSYTGDSLYCLYSAHRSRLSPRCAMTMAIYEFFGEGR